MSSGNTIKRKSPTAWRKRNGIAERQIMPMLNSGDATLFR